jgi:PilZ domain
MSGSMQDKRSDPRVPLIAAAEITEVATGTLLSARTSDISRTGCYIDTLNPTPVKTVVRVRLTHAGEELVIPARIVYVSPGLGMGVRFDEDLAPAQIACLDRWLSGAK